MPKKWWEWMKKLKWGWVAIVGGIIAALSTIITVLVVNPTFDLREKSNIPTEKLVISNTAAAFPPVKLVYTVADDGEPQCAYMPSPSYTLQTTRTIDFVTPLIWAPRKTYYPMHEGSKLLHADVKSGNVKCQEMNDASVAVWATGRRSSGEAATIILTWEVSNFPDNVSLIPYPDNDYVRVDISNPNNYDVQYLAIVESPPIKINTVYKTETEGIVASYNPPPDSPQTSSFPKSLEIRSTGDTGDTFKVNVPFVIDIPHQTEEIIDIQFEEQPPTIALVMQPSVPTSPPPLTQLWVLWVLIILATVVIAGVISVIVVLPIVLIRRRHRS